MSDFQAAMGALSKPTVTQDQQLAEQRTRDAQANAAAQSSSSFSPTSWFGSLMAKVNGFGDWLMSRPASLYTGHDQAGALGAAREQVQGTAMGAVSSVYNQVARIPSTTLLAANPASETFLNPLQSFYHSDEVSPGQAISSLPFSGSPLYSAITGKSIYGNVVVDKSLGINVLDPAIRKQAFEDSLLGKVTSGTSDVVISYFLDPLVVGGLAAKPAIAAARGTTRGVVSAQKLAKEAKALEDARIPGVRPDSGFIAGARNLFENRGNDAIVRSHWIVESSSDPRLVTDALHSARDWDEFSYLLMAGRGDPHALDALKARNAALADRLEEAKFAPEDVNAHVAKMGVTQYEDIGKGKLKVTPAWKQATEEETARRQAIVDSLVEQSSALGRAIGHDGETGIFGTMTHRTFSPLKSINEFRISTAARKSTFWGNTADGYWALDRYKPIAGGKTARVANWIGEGQIPSGWAPLRGDVGEFDRTLNATLRSIKGITPQEQSTILTGARAMGTAIERQNYIQTFEKNMVTHLVDKEFPGLTKPQLAFKKKLVEDLADNYNAIRKDGMDTMAKQGYMWDDETGEILMAPQFSSQITQAMPLMNFEHIQAAIKQIKLDHPQWVTNPTSVAYNGYRVLGAVETLWKPVILLRLGAVPRNVGEATIAAYVYTGRMVANPVMGTVNYGSKIAAKIRAKRLKVDGLRASQKIAYLQGTVDEFEANHLTDLNTLASMVRSYRGKDEWYANADILGRQVDQNSLDLAYFDRGEKALIKSKRDRALFEELHARAGGVGKPLTRGERAQYRLMRTTAAQNLLRRHQANGLVIVRRDPATGTLVPVDKVSDLGEDVLMPKVTGGARHPDPEVYAVPKATPLKKKAAKGEAERLTAESPDPAIYGPIEDDIRRLVEKMHGDQDSIAELRDDLAHIAELQKPVAKRAAKGTTPVNIGTSPGGRLYQAEGSFEGTLGEIARKHASSGAANRLMASTYDTNQWIARDATRNLNPTGGTAQYTVENHGIDVWSDHAAHVANVNVRSDARAMALLAGESPEQVAFDLLAEPGHLTLKEYQWGTDPEKVAAEVLKMDRNLKALYPNEMLRQKIVEGKVTPQQVKAYLSGRQDLVPVMDDDLKLKVTGWGGAVTSARDVADKLFNVMWTMPEDRLARWPFYNDTYRTEIKGLLENNMAYLDGLPEHEANQFIKLHLEPAAHKQALTIARRVMYTPGERSSIANGARFFSPFLQVTMNRFGYYGSQLLENPQNMARLFVGWNAIATDDQGRFHVQVPGWLAEHLPFQGLTDVAFNKNSANLIASGEPWYSPGSGPIVTTALSEWQRRAPDKVPEWVTSFAKNSGIQPFGPNKNWYTDFLPSWGRRWAGANGAEEANTASMIYAGEWMKYNNHEREFPPTFDEAQDKAEAMSVLKVFTAFVTPLQPTFTNPKLQPWIDLHRDYQAKYGRDAEAYFYADHPEFYDVIVKQSKNLSGEQATQEAVARHKEYQGLIGSLHEPGMAGLVANIATEDGKFDSASYQWQYGRELSAGSGTDIRGEQSGEQSVMANIVARGWMEYAKAAQERDSLLKAYGFRSMQQKDASWIKTIFEARRTKIIQDTSWEDETGHVVSPWWDDLQQQDSALYANRAQDLDRIVSEPGYYDANIDKQPWLKQAVQYLTTRAKFVTALAALKQAGGAGTIGALANQQLKEGWDAFKSDLSGSNPEWSSIQSRYFANDDLTEVPDAS